MPHTKSAAKRMKTSEEARVANRAVRSQLIKSRKALAAAVAGGDSAKAAGALRTFFSMVDKAAKKGVIKANAADRKKSRAAKFLKRGAGHQASTTAATT